MIKKEDIDQFYEDVKAIGLRFPVAAIAANTGQSKSNVSKYLKKKLEPSESFLKKFYEAFPKSGKNVSREVEPNLGRTLGIITALTENNRMLAEANLLLAKKISSGEPVSTFQPSLEEDSKKRDPVESVGSLDTSKTRSPVKKEKRKGSVV